MKGLLVLVIMVFLVTACSEQLINKKEVKKEEIYGKYIAPRELQGLDQIKIIDLRPAWKFNSGHVPGAISISIGEIDTLRLTAEGVTREDRIILYDEGGENVESAYTILYRAGFEKTQVLEGGFNGWINAELVIEQSY